jgi:hypothetical protein
MEIGLMAIYPVYNPETGEKKVIEMSVHDIMDWYENNKPWSRDWSQGSATPGEVGDWRNKLVSKHPAWNEVLGNASKAPKSTVKKI